MYNSHIMKFCSFWLCLPLAPCPPSISQLLLWPGFCAFSSSIFFTLSLNSSYWHFSYECLSSCPKLAPIRMFQAWQRRSNAVNRRTSHFQGRYQFAGRHLFRGMRRWAQESRYARGSLASDISCLVAAANRLAYAANMALSSPSRCKKSRPCMRSASSQRLEVDCARTGAGAAMAEANCIFEGFGDGHLVLCVRYRRGAVRLAAVKSRSIGCRPSRNASAAWSERARSLSSHEL